MKTQFKHSSPALLVLSFLSGFLGGIATGSAYHLELTLQQEAAVLAQVNSEDSQSEAAVLAQIGGEDSQGESIVTPEPSVAQVLEAVPEVVPPEAPLPQGVEPRRIYIPAIQVDATVIDLGLNSDGTLQVPQNFAETGWWIGGARPGAQGAAVIVGHFDSHTGPAIFYRLRDLQPGDEVQVLDAAGQVVKFEVEHTRQVNKNAFPRDDVYGKTEHPTLRLITCGGPFNHRQSQYRDNLIVFASRIDG
ncbi:class F sortase [Egbenema bharatensis]|uniref:class F sortase n=1 Tax=Egbenema bharatensis TaxID=3463334 RepID=UPI003A8A9D4A